MLDLQTIPPDRSLLCSVSQSGAPGPTYISPWQVALGAAVIVVNALVSLWLKLDMHWQLGIGAIRCRLCAVVLRWAILSQIRSAFMAWALSVVEPHPKIAHLTADI